MSDKGRFSSSDWKKYTTDTRSYHTKTIKEIFSTHLDPSLDPKGVVIRESRDSDEFPESNAIIIALDETGSMGSVIESMARQGLPKLVEEIYNRKPVADPQIMCMGIGDSEFVATGHGTVEEAPLQITQFETDIRIAKQLEKIYLEGLGGGNSHESYTFPWYFAAMHTVIDCFEKRKKKGYLFTVGDEQPTPVLYAEAIKHYLGTGPQKDLTAEELLTMVNRTYHVYHLMVAEGSHYRSAGDVVRHEWTTLLGQRALLLTDHTKMSEVIVSAIQVNEGADRKTVINSWDGTTSIVVANALNHDLMVKDNASGGVVKFR